jgi:hypothetical protein
MDAERRAERRRLILAHHPDRGGDPQRLIEELRRFDQQTAEQSRRRAETTLPDEVEQQWPIGLITRIVRAFAAARRAR